MTSWTAQQILALAPDPSSAKAGQDLAKDRKWVKVGSGESALWGLCQGSGKDPYQVTIDLTEPAFKCSCPSRKFPCKHGIGLFLLFEKTPALFEPGDLPAWAQAWLTSRQERAQKKAAAPAEEKPVDAAAQAKRAAQRESKVADGLRDFDLWLRDLVRTGLAEAASKPYSFWDGAAARLVDCQAGGIARSVREMAGIVASGRDWQARLLDRIGRIHLLIQAYSRIDSLPADLQAEVRTLIGWTQSQDDVVGRTGVTDRWLVAGQRVTDDDHLQTQRTYLIGAHTGAAALLLHFAAGTATLDKSFVPGTAFDGEVAYFDGAVPLRAVVKQRVAGGALSELPGHATIRDAVAAFAGTIASSPWIDRYPLSLAGVVPVRHGSDWIVRDAAGDFLPLAPAFPGAWKLAALSGGQPVTLFGEWDGFAFLPLGVVAEGRYIQA